MFPTLFHVGHFSLPTFGALAAIGLMLSLSLSERTAPVVRIDHTKLWDAGLFAVLSAFVLSRLLLVLTNLKAFLAYPILLLAVPSLTATGLLLTAIATLIWLRVRHIPILSALDAWAPCGTLIWTFLALGHFAEASDTGLPSLKFIAMHTPGDSTASHPVALYAAVSALLLTWLALRWLRSHHPAAAWTLMAAGTIQFFLSFFRMPSPEAFSGLDPLQWTSLGMIAAGTTVYVLGRNEQQANVQQADVRQ